MAQPVDRRATGRWLARLLQVVTLVVGLVAPCIAGSAPVSLPILVYHQIRNTADGPPDSLEAISLSRFEEQMRYLHDQGYVTLSADEVVHFIRDGKAPADKIVAIHFDDGWKSAQLALPVLDRYAMKATFWIIAGKGIGWPHMDWDELQAIARNPRYDLQSHTMTHPWKKGDTMLDWINGRTPGKGSGEARWELAESRRILAEKLGRPVSYLAWPAGHYNNALVQIAAESGYEALFTVDDGLTRPGDDPLRIRRVMVHGGCDARDFEQLLRDGVYRECKASAATR